MPRFPTNPFDSIESAHEFVDVLAQAVTENKVELQQDIQRDADMSAQRRRDALLLALYNVEKLEMHITASRRILNDLRSLRRLLFEERQSAPKHHVEVKSQPETKADVLTPHYEKPVLATVASFRVRRTPTTAA